MSKCWLTEPELVTPAASSILCPEQGCELADKKLVMQSPCCKHALLWYLTKLLLKLDGYPSQWVLDIY